MSLKFIFLNYCVFLAFSISVLSQSTETHESFLEDYEAYFKSDRKTVHLHLNKSTFITGEHIWFSSYVFNQMKNLPSKEDEYIYVDLIDKKGEVIASKTILFKNGSGKGDFLLNEYLETGNYFIQAYTSNMQNFEEDESTVYPIQIKNIASGNTAIPELHTNRDSLHITIAAESGTLVEGLFSTLAVRITNTFGYGLQPDSLWLVDERDKKLSRLKVDKNGLGIFSFVPQKNKSFSLIVYTDGKGIKKSLPLHQPFGETISVDRNHQKKQFVITINSKSPIGQKLNLILHKDGNVMKVPLIQNKEKQALILSYDTLESGMNTLSLLDNEGKILAERLIFHSPSYHIPKIELKKSTSFKDSVSVAFQISALLQNSMVSASILPGNSRASKNVKKAFYSIYLEAYLNLQDWQNLSTINCQTIKDLYYLDNVVLLAKAKYKWNSILNKGIRVPDQKELTTTLDGYINAFKEENESLQVLLYSKENEMLASTPVDAEKKFVFENVVLAKGSKINLTLSSEKGKPMYANFFYTIKPSIGNFRYRYQPKQFDLTNTKSSTSDELQFQLKNIEQLNEVTVTASKLKYQEFFKGYYGIKIDSTIGMTTLKDFLTRQGYHSISIPSWYRDVRRAGTVQTGILSRRCGYIFPTIMINGKFDEFIDIYESIRMEFIDEIYFDRPTLCSAIVVVFTNAKYNNRPLTESEKISKEFVVENGYDIPNIFKRPDYFDTSDDTFNQFGVLSWLPFIASNNVDPITLVAPMSNQNSIQVVLEGMSNTGEIISQDFLINLKE